jgi:hypothetical protein
LLYALSKLEPIWNRCNICENLCDFDLITLKVYAIEIQAMTDINLTRKQRCAMRKPHKNDDWPRNESVIEW